MPKICKVIFVEPNEPKKKYKWCHQLPDIVIHLINLEKPYYYVLVCEPSWKAMVVRGYLVREVWDSMRCSTVFSRVPGTEEYSDQNLPVRLLEPKRYHKTITQYMCYIYICQVFQFMIESLITGTVLLSTELLFNNVVLGVEVRWSIRNSKACGKMSNRYLSNRQFI